MALQITESLAASNSATQMVNQLNGLINQISGAINNGIPARGSIPAVTSGNLFNALGPDNYATIQAVLSGYAYQPQD